MSEDLKSGTWWDDMWPLLMADSYSMIGEVDEAFRWLDHAVEFGLTNTAYLQEHDPFLENLKTDRRFAGLMSKASESSDSFSRLVDLEDLV